MKISWEAFSANQLFNFVTKNLKSPVSFSNPKKNTVDFLTHICIDIAQFNQCRVTRMGEKEKKKSPLRT